MLLPVPGVRTELDEKPSMASDEPSTDSRSNDRLADLVGASASGSAEARAQAIDELYATLRQIAHGTLRGYHNPGIQTTMLVHEGYLRLFGHMLDSEKAVHWSNRDHLLRLMAIAMRRVLVDFIRRERSARAGGGGVVALGSAVEELVADSSGDETDVLVAHETLERLHAFDPKLAEIEECRLFGGFSIEETARIVGVSLKTVKKARAHLRRLGGR